MRAILIDPITKTVAEVNYDGNYKSIYSLIGCDCYTVVNFGYGVTLFVDDEGLLTYPNPHGYFRLNGYNATLASKGLLLSTNAEGESVALTSLVTVESVQRALEWVENPLYEEVEPKMEVLSGDDALKAMGLK